MSMGTEMSHRAQTVLVNQTQRLDADHSDDLSLEGKNNPGHTPMHYDSETDEYYTDVGSAIPKQESMEVYQVNSVANNQKEQVKQLLRTVVGLLK